MSTAWLTDIAQDLRYALRTFRRSPGLALAAILTLALGIGANTTVFSIADAVLFKFLPVRDPERLMQILQPQPPAARSSNSAETSGYRDRFTFADYLGMKQAVGVPAELLAEWEPSSTKVTIDGTEEIVRYSGVSGNYFGALGVRPIIGRVFEPAIDKEPEQHPEVVISYRFWQQRYHRDPGVIGRTIQYAGGHSQIIGVIEPGYFGLQVGTMVDAWMPASKGRNTRIFLRLQPGVTAAQAVAPLQVWYRHSLMDRWGNVDRFGNAGGDSAVSRFARTAQLKAVPAANGVSPLREQYGDPIRIVFAVVAMVLLLACANVGNLLLARASVRQREMAVRKSVGASRFRLTRQLLTESLLLTGLAAIAGLFAARWTPPLLLSLLQPSDTPVQLAIAVDTQVLAFTALVALLTTVACGILPAWRASQVDILSALKSGTGFSGTGHAWQSRFLVAVQIALSLILLVTSALFVRTLLNLKSLDAGFDRHNLILADVWFRGKESDDRLALAWQNLLSRIAAIPGVESSSASMGSPFRPPRRLGEPRVANRPWDDTLPISWFTGISANYFHTFGGSLVQGRDFESRDFQPSAPGVAIINETMARRFFGNESPLGSKLNDYGPKPPPEGALLEIVGVASDMKLNSLRTAPPCMVYLPFTQHGSALKLGFDVMTLDVRTRRDSIAVTQALRRELSGADPRFALGIVTTQSKLVDDALLRERLLATVGSFFGALALLLAAVGLYATTSYSVERRTQEIGIRMALGAGQHQVLRLLLGEVLVTVGLGSIAGTIVAVLVLRIVQSLLFGLKPQDPATIAIAASLLFGTSLFAAFIPARRACKTAPIDALRNE